MWVLSSSPDRNIPMRSVSRNKTISNAIFHDCHESWSSRFSLTRLLSRVLRRNGVIGTYRNVLADFSKWNFATEGEPSPLVYLIRSPCRARLATKNTGLSFVCFARAFGTLEEQNEFVLPRAPICVYTRVRTRAQTRIRMYANLQGATRLLKADRLRYGFYISFFEYQAMAHTFLVRFAIPTSGGRVSHTTRNVSARYKPSCWRYNVKRISSNALRVPYLNLLHLHFEINIRDLCVYTSYLCGPVQSQNGHYACNI